MYSSNVTNFIYRYKSWRGICKCYEEISDKTVEINTTAQENIAGVRLVKAFAREGMKLISF